ncbi:hypothetical protein, variant 1 [Aphanomyces astaci]|uniref:CCZ1/INTU/HSP4 first Longin domain-containing protein n=1 Tax=Aphanomyces astaci TaxID=112090 RepID=W4GMB0_APHAT|nr:hypothetical protein, variant 1 [Aphanomyces astaci]ETV80501.1 hypothetical protein, variant 1 [Aphanomyces astaci]|eukprot:XP_009830425.1 hypothetical protein, variant 1 [Aphanomyces astaci]
MTMEVVVWHEDLGSDDDAATEEESFARMLYCWPPKSMQEQLRVLQLLQGVYAFSSRFSSSPTTVTHVQLTNMHYCFERVEPKVWIALGHATAQDTDKYIMETVLRDMYASFRLLHGGIAWLLQAASMEYYSVDLPRSLVDAGLHSGLDVLVELASCRKKMRKTAQLIFKIQHDPDTHDCTAATLALADLSSWASTLVAASPVPRLQAVMGNFFPIYLRNLDVKHLNCMHAMDGIPPAPADSMQQMAAHMLAHSLRSDVPAVMHCASFDHGQLVSGGSWDATQLQLVYRFLRLREQQAVLPHQSTKHPREVTPPWLQSNSAQRSIWASKQTYVDGGLLPPKKRTSARDLFVDAISSSSSSAKDDTTAAAARGFQAADGRFDADIAPDKLWRLPLFFDSTDVKSTADLIVWHDAPCTLLLCVQSQANSSSLVADVGNYLRHCVHVGALTDANPPRHGHQVSSSAFIHVNRLTKQTQLHNVGKFKGPVPPILMASCFPPRLLESLNVVRYDLESDDQIMDIFTKTSADGWIIVRRSGSLERELVAFMDAKTVESVSDLSNTMNTLIHTSFDTIFM